MFSIIENTHIFEENANKLELLILFGHFNFGKKNFTFCFVFPDKVPLKINRGRFCPNKRS